MGDKERPEDSFTIDYYNENAVGYVANTIDLDMSSIYCEFERLIPSRCKILDLGCGSGRDSAYFTRTGKDVISIDASEKMCEQARKYTDNPVFQKRIEDLDYEEEFDAIWACASLLHISRDHISEVIQKLFLALKKNGILYASWKYGDLDTVQTERLFSNYDEHGLKNIFEAANGLSIVKMWVTEDVSGRKEKWINVLARRVG
jgi:SAM-dependent methyltransferase